MSETRTTRLISRLHQRMLETRGKKFYDRGNHDLGLLMNGPYPPTLKRRISGRYGHLDNGTAARILSGIDCTRQIGRAHV